jgi:uncharacterized protein YegJ (DUF2314 family)
MRRDSLVRVTARSAGPVLLLALAIASAGCKRKAPPTDDVTQVAQAMVVDAGMIPEGTAATAGPQKAPEQIFRVAVYHLPRATKDTGPVVKALTHAKGLALLTELPTGAVTTPTLVVQHPKVAEYAPPSLESLRYSGRTLSDAQKTAMQNSQEVTTLGLVSPTVNGIQAYRAAMEVSADLAEQTGGLLLDDETRESYTLAAWRAHLDNWDKDSLPIHEHIVIHAYKEGELLRLVTLGMRKFGLPDVSVNQVSGHDAQSMASLTNLVCQAMLEGAAVTPTGTMSVSLSAVRNAREREKLGSNLQDKAEGKTTVHLVIAEPHEGDAQNRLLEIVFPGSVAELQARQNAVLSQLFGAHDAASAVKHDAALLEASKRAREHAMTFKPRYAKGRPELERLLVKAPFRTRSGGNEWMWVEVTRWEGDTISGLLENDPIEVDDLKAGARVQVKEGVIFDYILYGTDGGMEGNETGRLMEGAPRITR